MKRFLLLFLTLLSVAFSLSGCQKSADSDYYVKVGETEFTEMPRCIVTMSCALTETVSSLGFAGRLVGVCDGVTAPALAAALPACGTTLVPDTETILSLAPDVVFSPVCLPAAATEVLENAGISVLVLPYADTLEGILTNWQAIATVLGGKEWGERIDTQLRYAAEVILEDLKEHVTPGESAAFLMRLPQTAAAGNTWLDEILSRIGLTNAAGEASGWIYPEDGEAPETDLLFCSDTVTLADLQASIWQNTAAVAGERVIFLDISSLEAESPRALLVLQEAVQEAYPEADWQPLDLTPEMEIPEPKEKTFLEKLFG